MSSLADLPNVIGFFSYSRDNDIADDGAVSALANRIATELRVQLGRRSDNFKLWRDKDALTTGENWKQKLKEAVGESVFFIQMVSPSAVQSPFCRFELDSFIEREKELGRDDLVFPILYVSVPELDDSRKDTDQVLSIISERQYIDWRQIRHQNVASTEVKVTVEQFCRSIAGKLRVPWISPEERRVIEEQKRAEDDRRRQEDEAKRKAEEEERQKVAEAKKRAEEERYRKKAERLEQSRREEQERSERERQAREQERQRRAEAKREDAQAMQKVSSGTATPQQELSSPPLVGVIVAGIFVGLLFLSIIFLLVYGMLFAR